MNQAKLKIYAIPAFMLVTLLPVLFVPSTYCRAVAAVILAAFAGVTSVLLKKRSVPSVNHRQVMGLLAVIAVVYLVLTYLAGTSLGFYQNWPALSWLTFLRHILPAMVIICATELLRSVLLAQEVKGLSVVVFLICILADLLLGQGLSMMGNLIYFLDMVGLTLFPSLTSNLLYHHIARRYGALPNIVYRLLLSVTVSFLPIVPAIPDVVNAFLLMLLPLAVWVFIDLLYEKKVKYATRRPSKWSYVGLGAILACMVTVVMVISGQFRYSLLVIATPSMTGELNVGDAILYEAYDASEDIIREQDVVVFSKDDRTLIVHRVVDIENINGELRYITKGDANEEADSGYVTEDQLRGIVLCKVPHIGHPSLWLRDLFS